MAIISSSQPRLLVHLPHPEAPVRRKPGRPWAPFSTHEPSRVARLLTKKTIWLYQRGCTSTAIDYMGNINIMSEFDSRTLGKLIFREIHVDGSIEFWNMDTPQHDLIMFQPELDGIIIFNTTTIKFGSFWAPLFTNPSFLELCGNSDNRGQNLCNIWTILSIVDVRFMFGLSQGPQCQEICG